MDVLDAAIQIESIADATKELKQQITAFSMAFDAKVDALIDMVNRQADNMNRKMDLVIERTKPKPSCVFCCVEDNKDSHPTGRCCRYQRVRSVNVLLCPHKFSNASTSFKRRKL